MQTQPCPASQGQSSRIPQRPVPPFQPHFPRRGLGLHRQLLVPQGSSLPSEKENRRPGEERAPVSRAVLGTDRL